MIVFKAGDRVRLKAMEEEWVVAEKTWMTVREIVDMPSGGLGARCQWTDAENGRQFEKTFPLSSLTL